MNPNTILKRDYSKIDTIMALLGCNGTDGHYISKDLNLSFDLTATADDKVLSCIAHKLFKLGYESCKEELRSFLGV